MRIIKEVALVANQTVFGKIAIHSVQNEQLWNNWKSSPSVVPIPDGLPYIQSGWNYDGSSFTATENANLESDKPEDSGNVGFAFVLDGVVFDSIYPNPENEIGQRYLDGLSSNPVVVEVPEDQFVMHGDTWDGSEFKPKDS